MVNAAGSPQLPTREPLLWPPGMDTVGAVVEPVVLPLWNPVHAEAAQAAMTMSEAQIFFINIPE